MKPNLHEVTERIRERSAPTRYAYLQRIEKYASRKGAMERMGCANMAHVIAGIDEKSKIRIVKEKAPNVAIVTAYNEMLSAHQPYVRYPDIIKAEAQRLGATAQVAGGVPAMCDGITQGYEGMELSLFSRDVIAMSTAIALSHDVFDAGLFLGICDKIVPGLLIGALHFGYLPCVFVPSGPMATGIDNHQKSKVREEFAKGKVNREELFASETAAYHSPGTCTFYGTANSNQMLLEAMGLHIPGAAFVPPHGGLRDCLTREAVRVVLENTRQNRNLSIGKMVDEKVIVNAIVALLATGGSTNHCIHWIAVARAAGILVDWSDFASLSENTPLLARVYPNGDSDVNQFQNAGGPAFIIRELINGGYMHEDVQSVVIGGLRDYCKVPSTDTVKLNWTTLPEKSPDESIVRHTSKPFSASGGLRLLQGNIGRAIIKISAVPEENHIIEAPAVIFNTQEALFKAFEKGSLEKDFVAVVRFQGPKANGMPELHKLTPPLSILQSKGFKVALVTDGRMSGASGRVPAAIHVSPEAISQGAIAKIRDGDIIRLNATAGTLNVLIDAEVWQERECEMISDEQRFSNGHGVGRELFGGMRRHILSAEEGAVTWLA